MFNSSYTIATVWGIPIRIHSSLLLAVLFLVWDFGLFYGVLLEAGLVISIVLHELGHSLVAIRKGCRVREITLMCIGGAAQMERIPRRPWDEFLMAVAGPLVSFVLGWGLLWVGPRIPLPVVPRTGGVNLLQLLGWINIGLVLFNLLPAFPMDGGRVLRALLSLKMGRLRATFIAARLGRILAVLLGLYGFSQDRWLLVFIAFFIFVAAGNEYRMVQVQEAARRGFDGWPFFDGGEPPPGPPDDDEVVIGPPPYERDGVTRTEIRPDGEDGPFRIP